MIDALHVCPFPPEPRVVLAGLRGEASVAELCWREGIGELRCRDHRKCSNSYERSFRCVGAFAGEKNSR